MIYGSQYEKEMYDKSLPPAEWSPTIGQTAYDVGDPLPDEYADAVIRAPNLRVDTIGQPEAANSDVDPCYMGSDLAEGGVFTPGGNYTFMVSDRGAQNYTTLRTILDAAFNHAATGKGKERHARGLPFDEQPMLVTTRMVGPGFPLGQAIKKSQEAAGMIERSELDAAEAECLGAINYLAGAVAWMREVKEGKVAA